MVRFLFVKYFLVSENVLCFVLFCFQYFIYIFFRIHLFQYAIFQYRKYLLTSNAITRVFVASPMGDTHIKIIIKL